jgi:hypothetical protein
MYNYIKHYLYYTSLYIQLANVINIYVIIIPMIKVDYNQHGHTSGENKYWSLDPKELDQGLCHQPTTLHGTQCCHRNFLSCSNVWMHKTTKFKI